MTEADIRALGFTPRQASTLAKLCSSYDPDHDLVSFSEPEVNEFLCRIYSEAGRQDNCPEGVSHRPRVGRELV